MLLDRSSAPGLCSYLGNCYSQHMQRRQLLAAIKYANDVKGLTGKSTLKMKVGKVTCNARMMVEGTRMQNKEYTSLLSHA